MNVRLYLWQRLSAAIMVPLLAIHLALILYAGTKGLSAADILARTRGSMAWALFYGVFVAAASVHAAIGVRNVLAEWTPLEERHRDIVAMLFGLILAGLGLRAVAAVVMP
jgi:fumarate reductase subunit C